MANEATSSFYLFTGISTFIYVSFKAPHVESDLISIIRMPVSQDTSLFGFQDLGFLARILGGCSRSVPSSVLTSQEEPEQPGDAHADTDPEDRETVTDAVACVGQASQGFAV